MTSQTVWQALVLPPWRFLASWWPWRSLVFVTTSAVMAPALVAVLAITILLLPIWAILVGWLDRRRLRLLGLPLLASGHVRVPPGERQNWLGVRLTEPATWRELVSLIAGLVFGAVSLGALFGQAMTLILIVGVSVVSRQREGTVNFFADLTVRLGPENWWHPLLLLIVAPPTFAYVNGLLAALHGGCLRWLLAPRIAEIDERVARLTRSRAALVAANEAERRRIERDLHDGVQQELVAIAARLGILELELQHGDDAARMAALEAAQQQTERALDSLRSTVRGIHPAVLSDHGLAPALTELASRSAMPLRIEDRGFPRLSPAREAAAYFFVAEALTNAAKHTSASVVRVALAADDECAYVIASDTGHGGVDLDRGTGLRGLRERADALDGELAIDSPVGGPTRLTLSFPLSDAAPQPSESDRRAFIASDPERKVVADAHPAR
ncbi:signal transduction histidine kinase [Mycolicibacterium mucogenicum 261Sha1.1M5]|nr:signal transduction histidine kinase [Mycolicibacterium mucogenicum 261Sha1.1M5]